MADFLGINKQTNKVLDVVSIQLKVQINKNTNKNQTKQKPPITAVTSTVDCPFTRVSNSK